MRYFLTIICTFFLSSVARAQLDTLVLNEVSVYGIPIEKYAVGQKVNKVDSAVFKNYESENLQTLLSRKASIYMKSYGSNMASTISFRGTGPSHTAVYWNGLEISSITLGQTDFSLVPTFVSDEVTLHYGSASALYGSGAIGGTISLQSLPRWDEEFNVGVTGSYASFGTYHGGANVRYGKGDVELKTKAYYHESDNDFEYELPSTGGKVNQRNAAYQQVGFSQDVNIKINSAQQLLINGWYTTNYRENQPVLGDFNNNDNLEDESLRLVAAYHHNAKPGYFIYRLGYIHDYQIYNESSEIRTHRLINNLSFERKLNKTLTLQAGANWTNIRADADNYEGINTERRLSASGLLRYAKDRLTASLNIRQTFVTGYNAPVAPSLGVEYALTDKIDLTGQVSRNYRVPTLNDRFWVPGGNPDVKSEESYNAESGITFRPDKTFDLGLNYYKMWVDDWIIWLPEGGVWSPENINKVNSEGVEVSGSKKFSEGELKLTVDAEYAFTRSIVKETFDSNNRAIGKQLAYTPEHTFSLSASAVYRGWQLLTTSAYTGERFTDSNNSLTPLESYWLVDLSLSKSLQFANYKLQLAFQTINALDVDYQTLRNRAMPGRQYRLTINLNFNKPNN